MKELLCDIIKKKIKNSHYHKFEKIAPEGFVLITQKTLERLRNFDHWKEWKNNPKMMEDWMKEELNEI